MGFFDFLKSRKVSYKGAVLRYTITSQKEDQVKEQWKKIDELLKIGKPSQLKQAVIEADRVIDSILLELTTGPTMGERLKAAGRIFKDGSVYDGVWQAHKTRNALVHESSYEPPYYVCRDAVEKFKRAILHLNIKI